MSQDLFSTLKDGYCFEEFDFQVMFERVKKYLVKYYRIGNAVIVIGGMIVLSMILLLMFLYVKPQMHLYTELFRLILGGIMCLCIFGIAVCMMFSYICIGDIFDYFKDRKKI